MQIFSVPVHCSTGTSSELSPPVGLFKTGLDCEMVLFVSLLNIENAVKWFSSEVILILRSSQIEARLCFI